MIQRNIEILVLMQVLKRIKNDKEHPINLENNKKKHRDTLTYVGSKKQDR